MSIPDDQQFCLRWNNFQANITSQFETLRDDEDFVDVTLACEGQRLEAHKVVLSACSPFFKELFKSNPCPHPIIFMRDVEARHIVALLEFMYAGEVNVAQAHLSAFLRTAESLQIRGLTDASRAHKENNKGQKPSENSQQSSSSCHNTQQSSTHNNKSNQQSTSANKSSASSQQESVKSSSKSQHNHSSKTHQRQQSPNGNSQTSGLSPERHRPAPKSESPRSPPNSPPPSKKHKSETTSRHQTSNDLTENNRVNERLNNGSDLSSVAAAAINPFAVHGGLHQHLHSELDLTSDIIEPKVELPDYASDDDMRTESRMTDSILGLEGPNTGHPFASLHGGMEIIPGTSGINMTDVSQDSTQGLDGPTTSHHQYENWSSVGGGGGGGVGRSAASGRYSSGRRGRAGSADSARRSWLPLPLAALDMAASPPTTASSAADSDLLTRYWTRGHTHHHRSSGGVVKLGEGVEICEEQLRSVKWSDYRKLTRGLATILFSPMELATCSVTGQRWSRAGTGERPVKPALDRAKVQAIISYVATRFPMVEISRIKQVLAYKCKENSTAFKMKAVRFLGDQQQLHGGGGQDNA